MNKAGADLPGHDNSYRQGKCESYCISLVSNSTYLGTFVSLEYNSMTRIRSRCQASPSLHNHRTKTFVLSNIYSEDVRAINPAIRPKPMCTLTAAAAPVCTLVLVDVADGITTPDDDALVVVATGITAAEVVEAALLETEDESEDAAAAVDRIVTLSGAATVAEAVAAAEYALAILSIAVVSPLR